MSEKSLPYQPEENRAVLSDGPEHAQIPEIGVSLADDVNADTFQLIKRTQEVTSSCFQTSFPSADSIPRIQGSAEGIVRYSSICFQYDLRMFGFLIGIVDPCKLLDGSPAGFFVKTLYVPLFAGLNGTFHVDLNKFTVLDEMSYEGPVPLVGRNKGSEHNDPCVDEKFCHFPDPPDVFFPFFSREPQVSVQSRSDIISIENIGSYILSKKVFFQPMSERRLAGTRKPCKPENERRVPVEFSPDLPWLSLDKRLPG